MSKWNRGTAKMPTMARKAQVHAGLLINSAAIGARIVKVRHTVLQHAKTIPVTNVGVNKTTYT